MTILPTQNEAMTPIELPRPAVGRLASIDAYRGFVMFLMMAEVLTLWKVSAAFPDSTVWAVLKQNQSHAEWVSCILRDPARSFSLHDLIQPSFSFLVGAAMAFSLASRRARNQSTLTMTLHALWRAIALIALGIFLRSIGKSQTNYTFEDTLTQIGLGYFFLYLLGLRCSPRVQWIALVLILVGYWAAFAFYPLPGADFNWEQAGVTANGPHNLTGLAAHWNKNTNAAWAFDTWFLNLFPREHPFTNNGGGYSTLSFIPTLGTMILGLIAGGWLRSDLAKGHKWLRLVLAGILLLTAGEALGWFGICPVVKKIWTPSWVLYSGGLTMLLLAGFYLVMDIVGFKIWAFPLLVIGANSIVAYCMDWFFVGFIRNSLHTHLGSDFFTNLSKPYAPLLEGAAVLLALWLILLWLYRKKVFVKI